MSIRRLILLAAALVTTAAPLAAQESRAFVIQRRPTIGVSVAPGPPVEVRDVIPDSPADLAGIRRGDVIEKVNGRDASYERLRDAARNDDEPVRLEIRRGDEELVFEIVPRRDARRRVFAFRTDSIGELAENYLERAREAAEAFGELEIVIPPGLDSLAMRRFHLESLPGMPEGPRFHFEELDGPGRVFVRRFFGSGLEGARLTELNEGLAPHFDGAERGVLVLEVEPDSRAGRAGLGAGDVIVEANGRQVYSPASLRVAIAEADRDEIALTIVREGARRTVRMGGDEARTK